jgi:hypothetical protein
MKGTMGIRLRRNSAKAMLEAQLKTGKKPEKIDGKTTANLVALTDGDRARINRELDAINNPKKNRSKAKSE